MKKYYLLSLLILSSCSSVIDDIDADSDIAYTNKTGKLRSIVEVRLEPGNEIILIDEASGLHIYNVDKYNLDTPSRKKLKVGESCILSDGHHASITYTLMSVDNDRITLHVRDAFYGFGDNKIIEGTVNIYPYKRQILKANSEDYWRKTNEEQIKFLKDANIGNYVCNRKSPFDAIKEFGKTLVEYDPAKQGIQIELDPALEDRDRLITFSASGATAFQILSIICNLSNFSFELNDGIIIIYQVVTPDIN